MTILDRNSPVPLYYQLKELLLEKLENGEWQAGDLVPSEQELQETYGLSRITVRQAFSELAHEGRFIRRRGQGTFVAPKKIVHNPKDRISITELMREQGITPEWEIRERKYVDALPHVKDMLKLTSDEQVYCVELLLNANGEPIGRHLAFLPSQVAEKANLDELSEQELRVYLRNLPNQSPIGVDRIVQAVPASEIEAELLKVKPEHPILSIEVIYKDVEGNAIEYLRANYRGESFKFELNV
ncbi:MAG: GntR family transcriptional regulator [Chloroflexi bacterium]|nr:GntR family transcriptional regulator [Chloroflexota bacterium]